MASSVQKSIAKNTSVMVGAQVVTWASSFVLLMFLPRYLGSAAYGKLYLAISIGVILEVLIDFGGRHLIPKEVSREKSKTAGLLVNFLTLRALIWIAAMGGLLIFNWLVGYPYVTQLLILILGFSKLWKAARQTLWSCFQGHERMEYPSLGSIVERVFIAVVAVSALMMGAGVVTVAVVMTIGVFLNFLVLVGFAKKIVLSLPSIDWNIIQKMSQISIPYFMWSLFSVIYYRVDTVMLSLLTNDSVVGWYGAAYRFFDIVMVFPSIFTTVIFPIFSRLWVNEQDEMLKTFKKSIKFMILMAFPVSIGIYFYSSNIVSLFFGLEEYQASVTVLQIFSIGIILVYVDFVLGNTILATDEQKKWAIVGFVAIFLNIILNYFAIQYTEIYWQNGGLGAAITTLITELFILVSAIKLIPNNYVQTIRALPILRVVMGGMVMVGICHALELLPIYWMIKGVIGGGLYFVSLWHLGVFDEDEERFIKKYSDGRKFWRLITKKESTIV